MSTEHAAEKVRRMVRRLRWRVRRYLDARRAPWPIVSECFQHHQPDHACAQCDGKHQHLWQGWAAAPRWVTGGGGTPVRCVTCGGRKCDADWCDQQRHRHNHQEAER